MIANPFLKIFSGNKCAWGIWKVLRDIPSLLVLVVSWELWQKEKNRLRPALLF